MMAIVGALVFVWIGIAVVEAVTGWNKDGPKKP